MLNIDGATTDKASNRSERYSEHDDAPNAQSYDGYPER